MAVTMRCLDCGHTTQARNDESTMCPQCEGTMKKVGAKAGSGSTVSELVKSRSRDDEDDEPRRKNRKRDDDEESERLELRTDDDEDEDRSSKKKSKGNRDGAAADSVGLKTGFHDRGLMRQVDQELARGEVLHWAARPSRDIAEANGKKLALVGFLFAGLGILVSIGFFISPVPWYVGLFPLIFVLIGLGLAVFGPKVSMKQAENGWYAVTDRRAIVYTASFFGSGGQATSYEPSELRRMRLQSSSVVEGGGDLIFKTEVSTHTHVEQDARGSRRTRTDTSTRHYGFMGIDQVREVETLIHNVLLDGNIDAERERARAKRRRDRSADHED